MARVLPDGLVAYKRTPVFEQDSIPAGLLREHRTKAGVWALVHVVAGRLLYRRLDPREEQVVEPWTPAVVQPQEPHEVEPLGPVRFFVEFHAAAPGSASPHEDADPPVVQAPSARSRDAPARGVTPLAPAPRPSRERSAGRYRT